MIKFANGRKEIPHSRFLYDVEDMAFCASWEFGQSSIDIGLFA
jgi:hypothetical protein